ncbi:amino acid adenylation domain-containing protein [Nonomuraea angiospora]|uniref:amino acid adenylation domain-containing protein n=1 Tax=Nonomuraea angiospora TaxID=46172 RepID=UPI0029A96284|nr:amino acid adenylation domain-containing protein [Nonomuraea angiospora]MDX3103356.1 amino acid adenylation domain-containing protein [Nonomuraea angiospora]
MRASPPSDRPRQGGRLPSSVPPPDLLDAYAAVCLWELGAKEVDVRLSEGGAVRIAKARAGTGRGVCWVGRAPATEGDWSAEVACLGRPGAVPAPRTALSACRLDVHAKSSRRELVARSFGGVVPDVTLAAARLLDMAEGGEGPLPPGPREARLLSSSPWAGHDSRRGWPDVCDLFLGQVHATPGAIAVRADDGELNYSALETWTRRLARRLVASGVSPGDVVAVSPPDRRLASVVALLAVLRAGAAYLPIGPDVPAERRRRCLAISGAVMAITGEENREAYSAERIPVVTVESSRDQTAAGSLPGSVPPETLAYVLFTSGSTGSAKAVAMPRRSLNHHVRWYLDDSQAFLRGRCLHFSDLGWDTSTAEIFPVLCSGGTVVVASTAARHDPDVLLQALCDQAVQRVILPPHILTRLAERSLRRKLVPAGLLDVTSGGEQLVLTPALREWFRQLPGATLQNHYGPTETQLVTAYAARPSEAADVPPIGRPCGATTLLVLDDARRPVPAGDPGELYIGGAGLAHGYLGDPDATADRFAQVLVNGRERRLYRTGDLVRWNADGNLQFLGRIDRQVKIRGQRVEPAEVEHELTSLLHVREAAVAALDSGDGKVLSAFVVASGTTAESLRRDLASRVPASMVPAGISIVERLPLTSNGKVDFAALLAGAGAEMPRPAGPSAASAGVADSPLDVIRGAWAEVLGVRPSAESDFQDVGGDSLRAMSLALLCRRHGISLRASDVLALRTPERMADLVKDGPGPAVVPSALPDNGPLAPSQAHAWPSGTDARNQWCQAGCFRTAGDVDVGALRAALTAVIQAHPSLRTAIVAAPSGAHQKVLTDPPNSLWLAAPERTAGGAHSSWPVWAVQAGRAALDLEAGRLVSAVYKPDANGSAGHLLIVVHQMAVDMMSWPILTDDLQYCYQSLRETGRAPRLGEATPFLHWVEALRRHAAGPAAGDLTGWREHAGAVTRMPIDRPVADSAAVNTAATAAAVRAELERAATEEVLRLAPRELACRPDEMVLHALAEVMADVSGATPVRLDVLGHGRAESIEPQLDLSRTTGWFTTVTPLAIPLPARGSVRDRLATTVAASRWTQARAVSYGALRYLGASAQSSPLDLPPADVSFDYSAHAGLLCPGDLLVGESDVQLGPYVHDTWRRPHLIEVQARLMDGRLAVEWTYSRALHRRQTVQRWADEHLRRLTAMLRPGRVK